MRFESIITLFGLIATGVVADGLLKIDVTKEVTCTRKTKSGKSTFHDSLRTLFAREF